jgi:hypothetical protein
MVKWITKQKNLLFTIPMLNIFREYYTLRKIAWRAFSLIFACNYFAFRTELFNEEFEQNHPVADPYTHQAVFSLPTLNWETFDKDNAPKAITVTPRISLELISTTPRETPLPNIVPLQVQIIRDKSPPRSF